MVKHYFLPDFNYEVIHYHHDMHMDTKLIFFSSLQFSPFFTVAYYGIYFQTHDICVTTLFRLPNHNRKSNFCELNKSIIKINIQYFIGAILIYATRPKLHVITSK